MARLRVAGRSDKVTIGSGLPQVNLLPPEIEASGQLSRVKRLLAVGVLAVGVVTAGLVFLAQTEVDSAQERVERAQAETSLLLTEKAKFQPVTRVLEDLDALKTARLVGTRTEVTWADYTAALAAVAPQEISIRELTIESETPMAIRALPSDPLQVPTLATIYLVAWAETQPDVSAWVDAFDAVPGLEYPHISSVKLVGDNDVEYYEVTARVQVEYDALLDRFVEDAAEETETGAGSDDEGDA